MAYEKTIMDWQNEGTQPPSDLIAGGWKAGMSPAPAYFNAFWSQTSKAIKELQQKAYEKPAAGIPLNDLSQPVKDAIAKGENAVQQSDLDKKANIESPTFTGSPKAPTPIESSNDTTVATTGFVGRAIATHNAKNTHLSEGSVTYNANVYTVTGVTSFTTYNTVRLKMPNNYVAGSIFKIGSDEYTPVNADFEANEVILVTFDKLQKKSFFKTGGGENQTLPPQIDNFVAKADDKKITLTWTISDATYLQDFLFVYKIGGVPTSSKDGTQVIVSKDARTTVLTGLTNDAVYYIRAYPRNSKNQLQSIYKVANATPKQPDDISGSPGPNMLAKGTMQEGYFGLVTASEMITGDALAVLVGITQGTSQFSTTNWLKFAYKGKVLFVAQKPVRYNLSWDSINSVGAVMGTKQVAIKSLNYKVRLLKGALTNPSENEATDRGAKGSEWNRLMLAVHEQVKNKNWAYPAYVEGDIQDFGTYFTDADLLTNSSFGNGSYSWCQETTKSNSSYRVIRGDNGVSYSIWYTSSSVYAYYGWRPVLELI